MDEVELVVVQPQVLGVVNDELDVGWYHRRLPRGKVCACDLAAWKLICAVDCPYACPCPNVQATLWVVQWREEQLVGICDP